MELSPREKDKLMIFTAGLLAERRLNRGLKLNYPEAIAYISAAILEAARELCLQWLSSNERHVVRVRYRWYPTFATVNSRAAR